MLTIPTSAEEARRNIRKLNDADGWTAAFERRRSKRIMKKTITILGVLFLGACGHRPTPIEPFDTNMCKPACARMADLGCPEGAPLPNGTSCWQFCEITQVSGHALNPTCLVEINSCGDIERCSVNRKGTR